MKRTGAVRNRWLSIPKPTPKYSQHLPRFPWAEIIQRNSSHKFEVQATSTNHSLYTFNAVLLYVWDGEGKIVQRGTLEEVNEEVFKAQHAPHVDWNKTTLSEYDKKFQDWRSSTLMQKLEQLGEDEL